MKTKTHFLISCAVFASILLASCSHSTSKNFIGSEVDGIIGPVTEENNPIIGTKTESLDFLFNPDVMGTTTITISSTEWNKLLKYYDWWKDNETSVIADYKFEKGGKEWNFLNAGFRIRGNTSRVRPYDKNSKKYVQSHFKVDFEEWVKDDTEVRLSNCIKGVNLKRFRNDPSYSGEVFSYNFFRANGVWTAPRSAYTKLIIKITEKNGTTRTIDYGMYEMIEEINKQYLKERTTAENGGGFQNNKGDLWKCAWGPTNNGWTGASMRLDDGARFGVEHREFTDTLGHYKSETYSYDLKTNKENIQQSTKDFKSWLASLNSLKANTESLKDWFNSTMDMNLFLKTYAANVVLGMFDDYWTNMNNYYFYFDKKGGKAYFIPFDYDNVLGITTGCGNDNPAEQNPFEWGNCGNNYKAGSRPLIEKALSIPEFYQMYADYLDRLTTSDYYKNASEKINAWQNMIAPGVPSADLLRKGKGQADTTNAIKISGTDLQDYFNRKRYSIEKRLK